jgi:hypothetical protein
MFLFAYGPMAHLVLLKPLEGKFAIKVQVQYATHIRNREHIGRKHKASASVLVCSTLDTI